MISCIVLATGLPFVLSFQGVDVVDRVLVPDLVCGYFQHTLGAGSARFLRSRLHKNNLSRNLADRLFSPSHVAGSGHFCISVPPAAQNDTKGRPEREYYSLLSDSRATSRSE